MNKMILDFITTFKQSFNIFIQKSLATQEL